MIRPTSIVIPFSEAPGVIDPRVFEGEDCWRRAQSWLTLAPRPKLGYYKTDFVITYEDGVTYSGRYDIGTDSPTLEGHIRDHLAYYGDPHKFLDNYLVGALDAARV